MEYLDIIEENFTKSDYVAYLRGSILKWLLEDKPLDIPQFKLYANKLVEVMDEPYTDEQTSETDVKIDVYRPIVKSTEETSIKPTVDPDEPRVFKAHKFKLGDHVVIDKGTVSERTGTIIRLPRVDSRFNEYIVDLDDKTLGWEATVEDEGVSCKNAWYAHESNMIPLEDTSKGLQVGKWYHTKDFTVEELQDLLPKGTTIETEKEVLYAGIETTPPKKTETKIIQKITTSAFGDTTLIEVTTGNFLKEWFKITEESK